jgi:hypothetical protein
MPRKSKKIRDIKTLSEEEYQEAAIAAYWMTRPNWTKKFNLKEEDYSKLRAVAGRKIPKNILNAYRKQYLWRQKK